MRHFVWGFAALVLSAGSVAAQDVKGSADHSLLPRYEGSEIRAYTVTEFDEFPLVAGPTVMKPNVTAADPERVIDLEGKVTHMLYRAPVGRSALEVFRNYETAVAEAGFEVLFTCARKECGPLFRTQMNPGARYDGLLYDGEQRFLSARLKRPEGDAYISLYVTSFDPANRPYIRLDVVEARPMESKMVVLDAKALESDITAEGRVAVYGVMFDFDKDTITADSRPQLDEIAKLLQSSPGLNVMIVGHTDAKGSADYNHDLSARRARSVVNALVKDFGIGANRLSPVGVGMAAPVATNRTEAGRAKNRRVELVDLGS